MIPVLCDAHQRLVLWGCTVKDEQITAELFYCDVHLPRLIKVSDRPSSQIYQVEIPKSMQGQIFPQKGQRITLRLLTNYSKKLS